MLEMRIIRVGTGKTPWIWSLMQGEKVLAEGAAPSIIIAQSMAYSAFERVEGGADGPRSAAPPPPKGK